MRKRTERKSREGDDDDAAAAAASAIIILLLLLLSNCKLPFPDQTTKLQQTPTLCVCVVCFVSLAYQGKDIVFSFIMEYSS